MCQSTGPRVDDRTTRASLTAPGSPPLERRRTIKLKPTFVYLVRQQTAAQNAA
jgi:hypothetical protein